MALIQHIAATVNEIVYPSSEFDALTAMNLDGLSKLKADDLQKDEKVYLWEERVDGFYDRVKVNQNDIEFVVITANQPSLTLIAKGNYKCTKDSTVSAVSVGYV